MNKTSIHKIFVIIQQIVFICYNGYGQSNRPNNQFLSEIILTKNKVNKIATVAKFAQNTNVELDLEEQFRIVIEKTNSPLGVDPFLPIEAFIREIQIETSFKGNISPIKKIALSCPETPVASTYPLKCSEIIPDDVKDKLNSSNISDLKITIRLRWYKTSEISLACKQIFPTDLDSERIDVFTIDVKHFGVLILFDFSPVSQAGSFSVFTDALMGIVYNLSYTGIDYAVISKDNNFTSAMLTAPIIRIEGRGWLNKNIEGHLTLVKDLNDSKKYLGFGGGVGLFGDTKIIKIGAFWYDKEPPRFYFGFSLIGLTKWITKQNKF